MKQLHATLLTCAFFVLIGSSLLAKQGDAIAERARRVHFSSIVMDTHIDVTPKLQRDWKFNEEVEEGSGGRFRVQDSACPAC